LPGGCGFVDVGGGGGEAVGEEEGHHLHLIIMLYVRQKVISQLRTA
jgi:hypothetical protein